MHFYKKGLLRAGIYALLGGLLTIPISCDQQTGESVSPKSDAQSKTAGDAGARVSCGGFDYVSGQFLGTWTATGSRLQVVEGAGGLFVAQITEENNGNSGNFIIRSGDFLNRGDIDKTGAINASASCFRGFTGGGPGWFVPGFSVGDLGPQFEQFNANDGSPAYRVKCSPRFDGISDGAHDRRLIGNWVINSSVSCPIEARRINGTLYVVQNITNVDAQASLGGTRDAFIIRGRNILVRTDVAINPFTQDPLDRGRTHCFTGQLDTGITGLLSPVDLNTFTINGYTRVNTASGELVAWRKN
ncbi:hypothetical protein [Fibrella aquatilis]|uniref:Uncharacterized protein n=1 Tax=Fibrella aquatilis TaxID=2817059 RepID=A0A939JYR0_9BACT|nr:hypothetical protein [Fibrella aquatilis]MBO0930638.1 hypothetical protein [Fibrella aquatilis]